MADFLKPLRPLRAFFWSTEAGNEPTREWLHGLTKEERSAIGDDLRKAQFGWPIGMPLCRNLGDGLSELRSSLPNNRIARLLLTLYGGAIVVLHGFIKKSKKIPKADLELAKKRKRELEKGTKNESAGKKSTHRVKC